VVWLSSACSSDADLVPYNHPRDTFCRGVIPPTLARSSGVVCQTDALVQLGDFAVSHRQNQSFLDVGNEFEGPKYHVLGNHDTDGGFSKAQTMEWWKVERRYYSFDLGGWHFIVLDGNDQKPEPWSG
jgi:calcineurin-like phosphoesterase family protein